MSLNLCQIYEETVHPQPANAESCHAPCFWVLPGSWYFPNAKSGVVCSSAVLEGAAVPAQDTWFAWASEQGFISALGHMLEFFKWGSLLSLYVMALFASISLSLSLFCRCVNGSGVSHERRPPSSAKCYVHWCQVSNVSLCIHIIHIIHIHSTLHTRCACNRM